MKTAIEPAVLGYLKTMLLVPDEVWLRVAGEEIEPTSEDTGVCGWVLRHALSRATDPVVVDEVVAKQRAGVVNWLADTGEGLGRLYGDPSGWRAVYWDILYADTLPLIEEAFTLRTMIALGQLSAAEVTS